MSRYSQECTTVNAENMFLGIERVENRGFKG